MLRNIFSLPDLEADVRAMTNAGSYSVQVIDYKWEAGFAADYCPSTYLLHARQYPQRTSMVGALGDASTFRSLGQLMLLPAGVKTRTQATQGVGQSHNIVCSFDESWLVEKRVPITSDPLSLGRYLDINNSHIAFYLGRLAAEILKPRLVSEPVIRSIFELMILDLTEHIRNSAECKRIHVEGGRLSPVDLRLIVDLIEYDPQMSMVDIAMRVGCTVGHLGRAFRNTTGTPLGKYLGAARINKAREMIASDVPMKQVAFQTGFSGVSALSKAYFKATGERPSNRHTAT